MVLVHCLLTDDDSSAFSLRLRTNEVCIRAHSARCAHRRHGTGERTQLEESGPRSWWLTADRLVCAQWLRDESACAGVSVSDTNWQRPSFCMFSCITARFIMKETQHETQRCRSRYAHRSWWHIESASRGRAPTSLAPLSLRTGLRHAPCRARRELNLPVLPRIPGWRAHGGDQH